ncbi:type VI secretion system baseplate subunit TssE [Pseudomonas caricapapayae]|uniref:type VI secretion system baseplate subunit TssE n=1 Tax=Pseudomonas caricapapayae TaxID=46678 RepID=UPI000EFF99C3|nr:type VI secretion system baseplate subunit TssE [Pseudomonas caricapapayae]
MRPLESLFQRLVGETVRLPGCTEEEQLMTSIATHLSNVLATRAGSVKMLPDYGLPDLNNMNMSAHETLKQSRAAIEKTIRAYEPRLSEVYVMSGEHSENILSLQFSIRAIVKSGGIKKAARFTAVVSGAGKVSVS